MKTLPELFANNRRWAEEILRADPGFFRKLEKQQRPGYLWIGCSDSRVPANEIVGLLPGELFVHRNVANIALPTDMNCLSVVQFAVEVLEVRHIIVCGHYGCGGVKAAMDGQQHGLIDNWLRPLTDVQHQHAEELAQWSDPKAREDRMCELNVNQQVTNVADMTPVRDAWAKGRALDIHGWIYSISNGLLRDLGVGRSGRNNG